MRLITTKTIKDCSLKNGTEKIYIDGRTIITKSACLYAEENGIELILVNDPVVNEKHLEATLHPEKYFVKLVKRVRRSG